MKLPWDKNKNTEGADAAGQDASSTPEPTTAEAESAAQKLPKGYTAPKGRPTPKRREVELERGVVGGQSLAPSDTYSQQRQKRKELKASMSKEEFKAYKQKERDARIKRQRETQAAMDRGEEAYLMDRDKGEVRRFARDWVDSRRFLSNFVMPVAIALLVVMLIGNFNPQFAATSSMVAMVLMLGFLVEGITTGRRVNKAARAKFPGTTETGFGLGYYAYSRSVQPRKWRTPRARVEIGADV
ncbi:DUF3043 domain-containing protein [Corynebacterium suranareeae]|uniref:DUF3043 domain-containing protein n=1 Tax=Corynebacterium suranareeae TaxID=2506452 RepID=UPI0018D4E396|nr:DUF3043 domain-containing protein [Corynebacterium suranareeae]